MKKTIIISIYLVISLFSSYCMAEIRVVNFEYEFTNSEIGDYVSEYDHGTWGMLYKHYKKFPIPGITHQNIQIIKMFGEFDNRYNQHFGVPDTACWGTWTEIFVPHLIEDDAIWIVYRQVYDNWESPSTETQMKNGKFRMVVMYDDTK